MASMKRVCDGLPLPTDIVNILMDHGCGAELSMTSRALNQTFCANWNAPEKRARYLTVIKRRMVWETVPHLAKSAVDIREDMRQPFHLRVASYMQAVQQCDKIASKTISAAVALLENMAPLSVVVLLRYLARPEVPARGKAHKFYSIANMTRITEHVPIGVFVVCLAAGTIAYDASCRKISITELGCALLRKKERAMIAKLPNNDLKRMYARDTGAVSKHCFAAFVVGNGVRARSVHEIRKYASFCDEAMFLVMSDMGMICMEPSPTAGHMTVSRGCSWNGVLYTTLQLFQNALLSTDNALSSTDNALQPPITLD